MPRVRVESKSRVTSNDIAVLQHGTRGGNVWLGVILDSSLTSYFHFKVAVNLNHHVSTARGAQPEIFMATACIFHRPHPVPDQGCFGVDQVELTFVEIAKGSGTVGIRALRKHGIVESSVQMEIEVR